MNTVTIIQFYGNDQETYAVCNSKIYLIQSVDAPIFIPQDYTKWGMPTDVELLQDLSQDPDYVEIVKKITLNPSLK